jgi:nucleoside-diphosphate-sugar epimerase
MKKILVTGGTGFIGSALIRGLLQNDYMVRVFDNEFRGNRRRLADVENDIEIVHGDIRDGDALCKACKGMDVVHHLAAINGTEHFYERPGLVLEVAVKGIFNVLDACKDQNVREILVASSSEVYQTPCNIPTPETERLIVPDPFNPRYSYGAGKILSELAAIHCTKDIFDRVLIYRPHNVYGPDMGWEHVIPSFIKRMKEMVISGFNGPLDFPIQGDGRQTRSFIFIDDCVNALIMLHNKGKNGSIYNVGASDEISIRELADLIALEFGVSLVIKPQAAKEGATLRRCPDTKKIYALGFRPNVLLKEGLKATIDWHKNSPNQ